MGEQRRFALLIYLVVGLVVFIFVLVQPNWPIYVKFVYIISLPFSGELIYDMLIGKVQIYRSGCQSIMTKYFLY
jgi:hypothetical protein